MTLLDLVKTYQTLLEQRDALAAEIKAINTDLEALKARIVQQMIDDDCLGLLLAATVSGQRQRRPTQTL